MFTGLVLGRGEIIKRLPKGPEIELTIQSTFNWQPPLELGESIAVSGVCLTVSQIMGPCVFTAHVSAETLSKTNLEKSSSVNLERALTLNSRLGGHLVSGHVDGLGEIKSLEKKGESWVYTFIIPQSLRLFIIPKGSITIDGVSLTVNSVGEDFFTVNIIPHTARITTLGQKKQGQTVNLETDLVGKYLYHFTTFAPKEEKKLAA